MFLFEFPYTKSHASSRSVLKDAFVTHLPSQSTHPLESRYACTHTQHLSITPIRPNSVHDWKRKLALSEVFGESLVRCVLYAPHSELGLMEESVTYLAGLEVHVVVSYLKVDSNEVYEWNVVTSKLIKWAILRVRPLDSHDWFDRT
jgi:hypothetical protein